MTTAAPQREAKASVTRPKEDVSADVATATSPQKTKLKEQGSTIASAGSSIAALRKEIQKLCWEVVKKQRPDYKHFAPAVQSTLASAVLAKAKTTALGQEFANVKLSQIKTEGLLRVLEAELRFMLKGEGNESQESRMDE